MYAFLITATGGWTWEYIAEYMTLPRLNVMLDHWSVNAPVHIAMSSVLAALGVKKAKPKDKDAAQAVTHTEAPQDARGNPTVDRPPSIAAAVQSTGGNVIRFKHHSLKR